MTATDDDDFIDLTEQLSLIVKSLFTPKGPHYNEEFKEMAEKFLREKIPNEEGREAALLTITGGMINSLLVNVFDDYGPEIIANVLALMAASYMDYDRPRDKKKEGKVVH